ncbi:MAG: styrene monooxygenase/indole monooxygenase family protein [Stellaceae bacterium]
MRKVTIVGGGQAGLQLGLGLRQKNYQVRVVSNRTADDIRTGKVLSSQCMFDDALQSERDLGLNSWEEECPDVDGIGVILPAPDGSGKALDWAYKLERPAQAVDQRVKIPGWMKQFEAIGGELIIHEAGVADLEQYCRDSDLVIVASGKGEISRLFERDAARSPFDQPARALALTYVTGMTPYAPFPRVSFNIVPGVGEYFVFPALTTTGPCEIMVFEGVPGGPMDCWSDVRTPDQHLARSKEILQKFMPWEAERCRTVALTDANGILAGRLTPTVRKPVAQLPSGAVVLGMADTVVLNDPITGQGSNNAAKSARIYLKSILDNRDKAFDRAWMQRTFDSYWDYAQWVTGWTNALLMPPPPHVVNILVAAQTSARIGRAFVNGFDDPRTFFPWLADPAAAERFIAGASA